MFMDDKLENTKVTLIIWYRKCVTRKTSVQFKCVHLVNSKFEVKQFIKSIKTAIVGRTVPTKRSQQTDNTGCLLTAYIP